VGHDDPALGNGDGGLFDRNSSVGHGHAIVGHRDASVGHEHAAVGHLDAERERRAVGSFDHGRNVHVMGCVFVAVEPYAALGHVASAGEVGCRTS
jgi:hypothetical protein